MYGHVYCFSELGLERWLCLALFDYFTEFHVRHTLNGEVTSQELARDTVYGTIYTRRVS